MGFVVLPIVFALLAGWFWGHCARPCLAFYHARPPAMHLVLGTTILAIVGNLISAVAQITDTSARIVWWLGVATSFAWIVVVGVGYLTGYRLVIRATGGRDVLPALRSHLWELGYALDRVRSDDPDPQWTKRARGVVTALPGLRTSDSANLIDLWLSEAADVLDGIPPSQPVGDRHEAIRAEAQRLWPSADDWMVAALVRG